MEEDVFLRHSDLGEAHGTGWWEQSGDQRVEFIGHNLDPIGLPIDLHESARGLELTGQISLTQRGKDAMILLRDGTVDALSIGFDPVREEMEHQAAGKVLRHLREVTLNVADSAVLARG